MLGSRLEEISAEEQFRGCHITTLITDESIQRQLIQEDEEEDFLDEGLCNSFIFSNQEPRVKMFLK